MRSTSSLAVELPMTTNRTARLQFAIDELVDLIATEVAERVRYLVEERITAAALAPAGLRLLRIAGVREKTGLSTSTIYRKIQHGMFPRQVNTGGTAATWLEADIDAWIGNITCDDPRQ